MTVENWFGSTEDLSLLVTTVKGLRQTGKFIWDALSMLETFIITWYNKVIIITT
jgi:hypothetical protein